MEGDFDGPLDGSSDEGATLGAETVGNLEGLDVFGGFEGADVGTREGVRDGVLEGSSDGKNVENCSIDDNPGMFMMALMYSGSKLGSWMYASTSGVAP